MTGERGFHVIIAHVTSAKVTERSEAEYRGLAVV